MGRAQQLGIEPAELGLLAGQQSLEPVTKSDPSPQKEIRFLAAPSPVPTGKPKANSQESLGTGSPGTAKHGPLQTPRAEQSTHNPRGTTEPRLRVNVELLWRVIRNNTEAICQHFYPQGWCNGHEWKIGDSTGAPGTHKGSLGFQLSGEKAGLCNDRATGQGWNLVTLLMETFGSDFPEAARRVGAFLGTNVFEESRAKPADAQVPPISTPLKASTAGSLKSAAD
jgi:hypothetical protein